MSVLRHFKQEYLWYTPFSNNWIASYVRKKRKESRKAPVCRIKHGEKKLTPGERFTHESLLIQQEENLYSLIILMFFPNFSIFPFFIKCRQFIVVVCFNFSIINSILLQLRDFHDISISQHLLNSVHIENTGEPSVCFLPWFFCRLLLNS